MIEEKRLTKEMMDDRLEQDKIVLALMKSIPPTVKFSNLIFALSTILTQVIAESIKSGYKSKNK